jgi:hypothetical protein
MESFEMVPAQDPVYSFTVNGHTFTAGNANGLNPQNQPASGMFAHSGTHYLHGGSFVNGGSSPVIWDLPSPQTGFGFFGTDVESGDITIRFVSGGIQTYQVGGLNFFWGILDTPEPVSQVTITPVVGDAVGYDDFVIVPEPGTVCLLGLGGLSLLRRRRK